MKRLLVYVTGFSLLLNFLFAVLWFRDHDTKRNNVADSPVPAEEKVNHQLVADCIIETFRDLSEEDTERSPVWRRFLALEAKDRTLLYKVLGRLYWISNDEKPQWLTEDLQDRIVGLLGYPTCEQATEELMRVLLYTTDINSLNGATRSMQLRRGFNYFGLYQALLKRQDIIKSSSLVMRWKRAAAWSLDGPSPSFVEDAAVSYLLHNEETDAAGLAKFLDQEKDRFLVFEQDLNQNFWEETGADWAKALRESKGLPAGPLPASPLFLRREAGVSKVVALLREQASLAEN